MNISGQIPYEQSVAHKNEPYGHSRHANFGALNFAVRRGDLVAAQTSFDALNTSQDSPATALRARGSLDGIGAALGSGNIAALRAALAGFHKRQAEVVAAPPPISAPGPETVVNILV